MIFSPTINEAASFTMYLLTRNHRKSVNIFQSEKFRLLKNEKHTVSSISLRQQSIAVTKRH